MSADATGATTFKVVFGVAEQPNQSRSMSSAGTLEIHDGQITVSGTSISGSGAAVMGGALGALVGGVMSGGDKTETYTVPIDGCQAHTDRANNTFSIQLEDGRWIILMSAYRRERKQFQEGMLGLLGPDVRVIKMGAMNAKQKKKVKILLIVMAVLSALLIFCIIMSALTE